MPATATKPLASPLSAATRVASWEKGWEVHRLDIGLSVPRVIGKWLVRQGLYARGNDFTSEMADRPGYEGNSTLKDLWEGKLDDRTRGMAGIRVFVLTENGKAKGTIAWLHADKPGETVPWDWFEKTPSHPNHRSKERLPVARLGHVMAFLKRESRGQGLIKRALAELVAPALQQLGQDCVDNGTMPIVGASDAMLKLMRSSTDLPLVSQQTVCRGMRDDVWWLVTKASMYPEDREKQPSWRYYAEPQPMPKPERKRVVGAKA